MGNRFVNVVVTRQTQAVNQQGFGVPLILGTEKASPYKEYTTLASVVPDFAESTNTYKLAAKLFGQAINKVAIHGVAGYLQGDQPSELTAALNTLVLTNNDWYYLLSPEQDDAEITALAAWALANGKLYAASTANKTLANTLNNERTFLLVHPNPETYPASAWVGVMASKEIGSATWTFKTLSDVAVSTYNETDVALIHTNKGNTYIREGGVDITSNGVTTSGEYIDIIQGTDFLKARMTENVFGLLVRSDKVPFTTGGIALVVNEVEKALRQGAAQGIIAKDAAGKALYNVEIPDIATISANDKAARRLPAIKWTATIAGAIEDVDVNGVLEV